MSVQISSPKAIKEFYEAVGKNYPEEEIVYKSLRGILRRKFVEAWLEDKAGFLLDIGTGEGVYLRKYKGKRAIGVDISVSKMRKARERLPEINMAKCRFVAADASKLGCFRAESIDIILCSELIEHLINPAGLWHAIYRILRPGGVALITCPNYSKSRPEWIELGILQDYEIPAMAGNSYYHTAYSPNELTGEAESQNLEVLESGTFEQEVRIAIILPVILYRSIGLLNRLTFRNRALDQWNHRLIDRGSLLVYNILHLLNLNSLFTRFIRRGVRSFICVRKTHPE